MQVADVLIDFTRPAGTLAHAEICAQLGKMVVGTTGFDEAGKAALAAVAQRTALVFAPNMSVGVNLTFKLLEIAAKCWLKATILKLSKRIIGIKLMPLPVPARMGGEVVARALGRDLAGVLYGREGITGERDP